MSIKERIEAEIQHFDEEQLQQVYHVVRQLSALQTPKSPTSLMAKLQKVTIEGPEDFSSNHDLYLSGEKRVR